MPRPPAVSTDSIVDAAVHARAGDAIECHFGAAELPRLREAGAGVGSELDVRLAFSLFDARPVIDGTLSGTIVLACQRCMGNVAVPVDEHFKVILVGEAFVDEHEVDEPGGYEPVVDATRLDLCWLAEEQALLALPLVPTHAAGECNEEAEQPQARESGTDENGTAGGSQQPFQNLRDMLRQR